MNPRRNKPKRVGAHSLARKLVAEVTQHGLPRDFVKLNAGVQIVSVGTERNTRDCLTLFIRWLRKERGKDWHQHSARDITDYLNLRSQFVRQSTLDGDRLALQRVLNRPIPYVVAKIPTPLEVRAYLPIQVTTLCANAVPDLSLSIALAVDCGVRAAELLSLAPVSKLREDYRPWHPSRFLGREAPFQLFCVVGKGGLKRNVAISKVLADEVKSKLLASPREFVDRQIKVTQFVNLLGGHRLSRQFTELSKATLEFSNGFHGLRHSYARRRIAELQLAGLNFKEALLALSSEVGHFSTANTLTYLR
jgi:integrase